MQLLLYHIEVIYNFLLTADEDAAVIHAHLLLVVVEAGAEVTAEAAVIGLSGFLLVQYLYFFNPLSCDPSLALVKNSLSTLLLVPFCFYSLFLS